VVLIETHCYAVNSIQQLQEDPDLIYMHQLQESYQESRLNSQLKQSMTSIMTLIESILYRNVPEYEKSTGGYKQTGKSPFNLSQVNTREGSPSQLHTDGSVRLVLMIKS
jgi:hypothetical protein